jgi:SAM-dependent methyltransferase
MATDFSNVTEVTGNRLRREAISMMYTRYRFAASRGKDKDVLEVGCGAGQGLGLLATSAKRVVGGDYTRALVEKARAHFGKRVPLLCLDGQALPFCDVSFDVVILYEAIYYLPNAVRFILEAKRVLRTPGDLIVCSANPQWSDFNPSPYSIRYFNAIELARILGDAGFTVQVLWAYASEAAGPGDQIRSWIRRLAVGLHLMPQTMKGKELLKNLFYGKLMPMPPELSDHAFPAETPASAELTDSTEKYKVFYEVGTIA